MLQKTLSTAAILPILAFSALGLLRSSVAETAQPASAYPMAWTAVLTTKGGSTLTLTSNHPAFPSSILPASALHKRVRKAPAVTPNVNEDALAVVRQSSILPKHQRIASDVLKLLPPWCSARLKNFVVRYDNPEQRGLAGKTTVILSGNVSDEEFRALAVHEIMGHFYELGCLDGTKRAIASEYMDGDEAMKIDDPSVGFYAISWKNTEATHGDALPEDFVSGYALKGDAFEDLAETAVAYVLHRDAFEALAKNNPIIRAKLQWMEQYMPVAARNVAKGKYAYTVERPWDMTKLAYEWKGLRATDVAARIDN